MYEYESVRIVMITIFEYATKRRKKNKMPHALLSNHIFEYFSLAFISSDPQIFLSCMFKHFEPLLFKRIHLYQKRERSAIVHYIAVLLFRDFKMMMQSN